MSGVETELISMADIARLAGQSRATVGNWKLRNPDDFPPERGRGPRGPLYDRAEVTTWLEATGRLARRPSEEAILREVADQFRSNAGGEPLPLLLTLLTLMTKSEAWQDLQQANPAELDRVLRDAVAEHVPDAVGMLPARSLAGEPAARAMALLSGLDRSHVPALADLVLKQTAKGLGPRGGGEFLSPRSIRKLVIALADPAGTVYNPATGAAQLMVDAAAEAAAPLQLVGQELNPMIQALSHLNLALHDLRADIALGDVFTADHYPQLRADRVVAIPPWGMKVPAERVRDDPRWIWGEPGPNDGNAAWIQHCLARLADGGRAVLVLPNGALFEGGRAGRIRQRILKAGLLDAVIALPPGLFPWTGLACAVLVFRKGRTGEGGKPASALMVDLTAAEDVPGRVTKSLSDRVVEDVATLYRHWLSGDSVAVDYAAVASYDDIAANDFIIDPGRYLPLPSASIDPEATERRRHDIAAALSELRSSAAGQRDLLSDLIEPTSTFDEIRLSDLMPTAVTVSRGFPTQRALPDGDVRVMSIAALRSGTEPKHFADRADLADLGLDLAEAGDVLVSVEGGTVGEVFVVPTDIEPFVPSQQVATIRVADIQRLDPWYLGAWLSTEVAVEQLRRLARGTAIQRIAMKDLPSLMLSVAPIDAQHQIGERLREVERSIHVHRAIASRLEELRETELAITFAHNADPGVEGRS